MAYLLRRQAESSVRNPYFLGKQPDAERRNGQGGFQQVHIQFTFLLHQSQGISSIEDPCTSSLLSVRVPGSILEATTGTSLTPCTHQLSMVVAGTGNFAFRSLLHSPLFATAFHRPRRAVLTRSKDPGNVRQSAKVKSMITMAIFTTAIFM